MRDFFLLAEFLNCETDSNGQTSRNWPIIICVKCWSTWTIFFSLAFINAGWNIHKIGGENVEPKFLSSTMTSVVTYWVCICESRIRVNTKKMMNQPGPQRSLLDSYLRNFYQDKQLFMEPQLKVSSAAHDTRVTLFRKPLCSGRLSEEWQILERL